MLCAHFCTGGLIHLIDECPELELYISVLAMLERALMCMAETTRKCDLNFKTDPENYSRAQSISTTVESRATVSV